MTAEKKQKSQKTYVIYRIMRSKINAAIAKYETDKIKYHEQMSKADQILEEYRQKCHSVLRNVYRILLTRGTKGCYIFCCDPQLQKYIKEQAERFNEPLI